MSLATRRFGSNFLSVGRVQSPTLALIVERELERRAHVAKPYWEVLARFQHPDEAFEAGRVPYLGELRLHNGTVYRWNRPVYDVVDDWLARDCTTALADAGHTLRPDDVLESPNFLTNRQQITEWFGEDAPLFE